MVDQAVTIAQLTQLRDFLLRREQDQREAWEAEKAAWVRIAGALTSRRQENGHHRSDVRPCLAYSIILLSSTTF